MAKQIILFRHAEASPNRSGSPDEMRELTEFGKEQARVMSDYILREDFSPDAIFCSPAIRTRQTTMILAQPLSFNPVKIFYPDELYEASLDVLIEFLRNIDDIFSNVLVVGHNPALSHLAGYLTSSGVSLTTASAAMIRLNIDHWRELTEDKGVLLHIQTPATEKKVNHSND